MRLALMLVLVTGCTPKVLEYDDADLDGVAAAQDCNDDDPSVFPGAVEVCNGIDDDCDGTVDEEALDAIPWYVDADGDGYGDDATGTRACDPASDLVAEGGDCDDSDVAYHPGATEDDCTDPNDYNCDGSVGWADADGDGFAACEDCDDTDADVYPGADEYCNGDDDDCDGTVDEDPVDGDLWYQDVDDDGYGDPDVSQRSCSDPGEDWLSDGTDCDDHDVSQNPGADERCATDEDDDCDGTINEDDAVDATTWYADADADGYGDAADSTDACEQPSGYDDDDDDCDDTDDTIYPGADEYCDGEDDDCDGTVDEDDALDATTWYADSDGDSYGDPDTSTTACSQPSGYLANDEDCDDTDDSEYPGADEYCDGDDDDCDGDVDEADAVDVSTWYADSDGDGFGDASTTDVACDAPSGYVADSDDCDDTDATVNPKADEYCDGEDDDCDGDIDEDDAVDAATWYADADADGYGNPKDSTVACDEPLGYDDDDDDCDDTDDEVNPGETDTCDGVDNDCSGDEDGLVSLTSSTGTSVTDLSSTWGAGTVSSPAHPTYSSSADIAVCPGTYYVRVEADGSTMSFTGPYGSSVTVLDGGDAGSVLDFDNTGATVTVQGLTLQGGTTAGGGIDSDDSSIDLTLDDVVITACDAGTSTGLGGGIYFEGGTLTATDLVLDDNQADFGGGLYAYSGTVTLNDCDLTDNIADYSGGGIYLDDYADLVMDGCTASGNEAQGSTGYGGAVIGAEGGDITLTDCEFESNEATGNAGGVGYFGLGSYYAGSFTATDCLFHDNIAYDEGGAFITLDGDMTFTDSLVYDNSAFVGGGVFALAADVLCEATTSGSYGFTGNTATGTGTYSYPGGGVYLEYDSSLGAAEIDSDVCDWGTTAGADNNSPEDVGSSTGINANYGNDATFTCDTSGC